MGWLAVAVIAGFLLRRWRRQLARWWTKHSAQVRAYSVHVWIALLFLGVVLFLRQATADNGLRLSTLADFVAQGHVARLLLGMALGVTLAYLIERRVLAGAKLLWLALGIAILAIVAPVLDGWLSRLTAIKASVLEIQLASTSTANLKVAVAENKVAFNTQVLEVISKLGEKIQAEIDYIQEIELAEIDAKYKGIPRSLKEMRAEHENYLKSAATLQPVFDLLLSKIAGCYKKAIDNGASLQRIQEIMKEPAYKLLQIVMNAEDTPEEGLEQHRKFWSGLLATAAMVDDLKVNKGEKCGNIARDYYNQNRDHNFSSPAYPRMRDYTTLPYLYVASASLLWFVNETDIALKVLQEAKKNIKFPNYTSSVFISLFLYYQGKPATVSVLPLDRMRKDALERQARLRDHCYVVVCDDVKRQKIKKFRKTDRYAEIVAINNFAYRVAEDIARGIASAKGLEATVEKYASELKDVIDQVEAGKEDAIEKDSLGTLVDTYAYTTVVIESLQQRPNPATFKKMARILQSIVEELDKEPEKQSTKERAWLLTVRTHYQSARELAAE